MERQSNWSAGSAADELALIRFVTEMQVWFMQEHKRYPSPQEIQREWHKDRPRSPDAA